MFVDELRQLINKSPLDAQALINEDYIKNEYIKRLNNALTPSLKPVVNATGVIVHTNLGRSLLPEAILNYMTQIGSRYSNLEFDLSKGIRGSRYSHVEEIVCEITGAESALVVNNNASSVLLVLSALARGKEVIVSRGELVEIGGSFRIPDVMRQSGAVLREVGATNRTHFRDYEEAICDNTAMLLKVHQSNFKVIGFTKGVDIRSLRELADKNGLYLFEDLGSGSFIDFSRYGLSYEPTVQDSIKYAHVISFSGDKLLGGPQAGIIIGKKDIIDRLKRHPLNRALRIDKFTICALEAILDIYRDEEQAIRQIPTLRMITEPQEITKKRAQRLKRRLERLSIDNLKLSFGIITTIARIGGGALPAQPIPSYGIRVCLMPDSQYNAHDIEEGLRSYSTPIIVRIEDEGIILDARTVLEADIPLIVDAFNTLKKRL